MPVATISFTLRVHVVSLALRGGYPSATHTPPDEEATSDGDMIVVDVHTISIIMRMGH